MATEHTYPNTARQVYLASGVVELIDAKNPRKRTRSPFSNIMVQGSTDEERRANFRYEKAFPWEVRKSIREMEAAGRVILVELNVGRCLGLAAGGHPAPEYPDVNEQYI